MRAVDNVHCRSPWLGVAYTFASAGLGVERPPPGPMHAWPRAQGVAVRVVQCRAAAALASVRNANPRPY